MKFVYYKLICIRGNLWTNFIGAFALEVFLGFSLPHRFPNLTLLALLNRWVETPKT